MNPKCQTRPRFDTFGAKSADLNRKKPTSGNSSHLFLCQLFLNAAIAAPRTALLNTALKPLNIDSPSVFFSGKSVGQGGTDEIVSPGGAGTGWDPKKNEITLMAVTSGTNFRLDIAIDDIDTLGNQSGALPRRRYGRKFYRPFHVIAAMLIGLFVPHYREHVLQRC
jgi:hypothetical protein